jgi:hypothetical protein
MYELARPYFPENEKLQSKIDRLRERLTRRREDDDHGPSSSKEGSKGRGPGPEDEDDDQSYHEDGESAHHSSDDEGRSRAKKSKPRRRKRPSSPDPLAEHEADVTTPRTRHLLDVINTRDVTRIKTLSGLGAKRAEGIVEFLAQESDVPILTSWTDLARLRGVGKKTLETMREGVVV